MKRVFGLIIGILLGLLPLVAAQPALAASTANGYYVALGDSVAAGAGLPVPSDAASNSKACGVSNQAYPTLVATSIQKVYLNLSCSGATLDDLFSPQQLPSSQIPPQIQTAFSFGKPTLITITAGANDLHWQQFFSECFSGSCGGAVDTTIANSLLNGAQANLQTALQQINNLSGGTPPPVIITGYYQPISAFCADGTHLTLSETSWLEGRINDLNTMLKNTSRQFSFAKFVPLDFSKHDLCQGNSWVQVPGQPAPLHPTATGQAQIANMVEAAITMPSPAITPSATPSATPPTNNTSTSSSNSSCQIDTTSPTDPNTFNIAAGMNDYLFCLLG